MTLASPLLQASDSQSNEDRLLTDFTSNSSDLGWYVVNDTVMGGRSEGAFERGDANLIFSGNTNTNGGGFSSIRTNPLQLDLSGHTGIQLQVKGDGRRYTWRLTSTALWRGEQVSYWADFETDENSWSVVNIPFSSFVPKYRGNELDGPELDPADITGMGLMIYDKQDGPFELQLASVRVYSSNTPFSLKQYQWKNRVLVVSAQGIDDENLKVQQAQIATSLNEFEDRDMILVTLLDNAVSAAADRVLTSEETASVRDALGFSPGLFSAVLIGKDGQIKLSKDSAISMNEIYALIDTMPMRRREKLER